MKNWRKILNPGNRTFIRRRSYSQEQCFYFLLIWSIVSRFFFFFLTKENIKKDIVVRFVTTI